MSSGSPSRGPRAPGTTASGSGASSMRRQATDRRPGAGDVVGRPEPTRVLRTLRLLAVAATAAVLASVVPAPPAAASVPVVVLDGTGWGHGVGLSQWGAEYLARTGRSASDILATFYPGASLAEATGPVRVAVHRPPSPTTTLTFPQGGEVRSPLEGEQAPGFPVRVGPGGRVRITFDGAYRVEPLMSGQSSAATSYPAQEPCSLVVLMPGNMPLRVVSVPLVCRIRTWPPFRVMMARPSGVNAISVGALGLGRDGRHRGVLAGDRRGRRGAEQGAGVAALRAIPPPRAAGCGPAAADRVGCSSGPGLDESDRG